MVMFNLNDDLEEANLAQNNKFRAELKQMISRLKQWVADEKDKFATPED